MAGFNWTKWLQDYIDQHGKGKNKPTNHNDRSTNPFLTGTQSRDEAGSIFDGISPGGYWDSLSNQNNTGQGNQPNLRWNELLARFGNNTDFTALLNAMAINGQVRMNNDQINDWNKHLVEQLLAYYFQQDNRQYNEGLRDEQRVYDSPTNQLARLMGAGISRDAALQLLGGSGAAGSAAGVPYSSGIQPSEGLAASQTDLNSAQRKTAIANTVFNGIQTLMSLASLGVDIGAAIPQIGILKNERELSDDQLTAYKGAKSVMQNVNELRNSGALSGKDLESVDALNDFYLNNSDNPNISPLLASPEYKAAFSTPFGRKMLNDAFQDLRHSTSDGVLFDNFVRTSLAQGDLAELTVKQGQRDFYIEFAQEFYDLLNSDAELNQRWQQYCRGEVEISIAGETLKQQRLKTSHDKRQDYEERVLFGAFTDALDTVDDETGMTGYDFINASVFGDLCERWIDVSSRTGNQQVTWTGSDGKTKTGTARQRYYDFLGSNYNAAITGSFLDECQQGNRLNKYNGSKGRLYKFCDMWRGAGANEVVRSAKDAVGIVK